MWKWRTRHIEEEESFPNPTLIPDDNVYTLHPLLRHHIYTFPHKVHQNTFSFSLSPKAAHTRRQRLWRGFCKIPIWIRGKEDGLSLCTEREKKGNDFFMTVLHSTLSLEQLSFAIFYLHHESSSPPLCHLFRIYLSLYRLFYTL